MIRELEFAENDSHFFDNSCMRAIPPERTIHFQLSIKVDPEDANKLRNKLLQALNITEEEIIKGDKNDTNTGKIL